MLNTARQLSLWVLVVISTFFVTGCTLFESKEASKGRKLFSFYCAHCHGERGDGRGYNADLLDPRPRDLTDSVEPYMAEASNEEIFNAIKNGVAGVVSQSGEIKPGPLPVEDEEATGSTLMPYWGFTLSDEEIWSLVAYIRTLHPNEAEKVVISDNPGESKKSYPQVTVNVDFNVQGPERERLIGQGKMLYSDKYSCPACHQINGSGGDVGPDLSRAGFRFNSKWVYRWVKYASSIKHETKMPNFAMPDEDALAITLYLSTLK